MTNPLLQLAEAGQAVWLDYLHRQIIENGELKRLIEEDGLKGMTSNPSIFEKAIGDGDAYDDRIAAALATQDLAAMDLYEALALADIQAAADLFRPVFDRLGGADGFVSLEVSPYLAMDTERTVSEARRLWRAVDRPNVMIKVPGTDAGVAAIRQLIGEGINVNVTLLFGLRAYRAVAEAHLAGLEVFRAAGGDISGVHGVASLFVSRIDTQIDNEIDRRLAADPGRHANRLKALRGKVAIANAKIAYLEYLDLVASGRWKALARAGAAPQRLLWASTGTKDPAFSDVLYVESLIGADTVSTMPVKTLEAFRDHGRATPSLASGLEQAGHVLGDADTLGLDLNGVCERLVAEGVAQFAQAFDQLLAAVAAKRARILGERPNPPSVCPPAKLQACAAAVEPARAARERPRVAPGPTPTAPPGPRRRTGDIALLIADVDGTLITPERRLTARAAAAVARLADVGIGFTLISSRPPQGLSALTAALQVRLPFAAFNGGNVLAPDMRLLESHRLSADTARRVLALLAGRNVDPWVFTDKDWRLRDAHAPHVAGERGASGLDPLVVDDFESVIARIDKIVGISDDLPRLVEIESEARAQLGASATVQRSHPYHLDVTDAAANKGDAVEGLCRRIGVELRHTAVIGDMFNDISMFARAGFSVAMGQAPSEVKAAADAVTASNDADGFAAAVERLIPAHGSRAEA